MKYTKTFEHISKLNWGLSIKRTVNLYRLGFFLLVMGLFGCSDFVEVDPPKNILISETVFNNPATVESALANIIYKMREQGMVSGNYGLTAVLGIYSDELDYYGFDADYTQLYQNNVIASNNIISTWWGQAYYLIYSANDIIKGVENSKTLTIEDQERFKGQALFVRAYIHSLLAALYGDIPYITTTDYLKNNEVSRMPWNEVNEKILKDLSNAVELLEDMGNASGEKVIPGQSAAKALLARIYLYTENWKLAASMATELIDKYSLEQDLNDVFLKESSETIWQLKPGEIIKNTHEANRLVILSIPGQNFALSNSLLTAFEIGDLRLTHWIGSISNTENTTTLYFANKYKATFRETESLEYSIVFRLAEQYLIRAEARAHLNDFLGAQQDLNAIRNRAGLTNITTTTADDLLDAIFQERRVELFTEQGHRWFDLKRTRNADNILGALKPNWQETDALLPIPETELETNPNLLPQNSGY